MANTMDEVITAGLSDELCPDCRSPYPKLTLSGEKPTPCGWGKARQAKAKAKGVSHG